MDNFILITSVVDLPSLSKYQWWTLFGVFGLVIGMLPKEKIFYLRRVLLVLCLGWMIIYLQYRYEGNLEPLSIFLNYSLPQLLFFGIPYRLADYFVKSELFKTRLKTKEDLESQLRKEYEVKFPSISKAPFEVIEGIDHVSERDKALNNAKKSLIIASGWVSKFVIKKDFISKLQALVDNGVKIRIIYGYQDNRGFHASDKPSKNLLDELQKNNKEGDVKILFKANHSKIIVVDDNYALVGSYNWLSNNKATNQERSLKTYDNDVIVDIKKSIKDMANS